MARTNTNAGFASAMTKIDKGAFARAREVKDNRGSFEKPEIEDGTYVSTLVSCRCGVGKNSNGYAAFDFEVARGDYQGTRVSKFHSIAERGNRTVEQALQSLFIDLQRLVPDEDFSEFSAEDIETIVQQLAEATKEQGITYQIGVKNNGNFINTFINKRLDEDVFVAASEEEDDELIPEKGDVVFFQPPRTKSSQEFTVTSVAEGKRTVTLKRTKDGKVFKAISFDHLEWEQDVRGRGSIAFLLQVVGSLFFYSVFWNLYMDDNRTCSICQSPFNLESEGGIEGTLGILPVSFCPWCYTGLMDMAYQLIVECPHCGKTYDEEPNDGSLGS